MVGGRSTSSTTRDLHAAVGSTRVGLYSTTAYFSIFATKVPGTHARGPIRLHTALAWIHGPGMVLTPVLGALPFEQKSRGERALLAIRQADESLLVWDPAQPGAGPVELGRGRPVGAPTIDGHVPCLASVAPN